MLREESPQAARRRFQMALGVYAMLAIVASVSLQGNIRLVVWILLAGLGVKTWIAHLQQGRKD